MERLYTDSRFLILSAIFLFFHVFFLGWTFDSEFLTKLRRSYVVFFILFEILAQAFLIRKILLIKDKFIEYFNEKIIFIKLSFVIFICSSSALILGLLIFYNFSSKIDYILEWNYFLILLIFYFLSFLMWKKPNQLSIHHLKLYNLIDLDHKIHKLDQVKFPLLSHRDLSQQSYFL